MSEINQEELHFQNFLDKTKENLINMKVEYGSNTVNVTNILASRVLEDWNKENNDLVIKYNTRSVETNHNIKQLYDVLKTLVQMLKKNKINFSNPSLSNLRTQIASYLEEVIERINITNIHLTDILSIFGIYLDSKTTSNRSVISNDIKIKIISINNNIEEIDEIIFETISKCQNYNLNLLNIREQLNLEVDKNFSKRFDEEKNIILEDFNNKLSQITLDYEIKQKEIKSEFNEIKVNFKKIKSDLDEINKKNSDLKQLIDNYEDTIKSLSHLELNKVNKNIDNFLSIAQKKLDKSLEYQDSSLKIKFNEIKTEFETQHSNMNSEFEIAKNAKESFVQLVQNAGIYNLTENYNNKANEEKIEYQSYRKYTTWSILAAVVFTLGVFIFAIYENSGKTSSPDYLILISRLSISAMFFILALYLSKQASKHYECYQENHRTFLQLAALEPFISKMTPEEQKEIRKGLISSYFNQNTDGKFASKGDEIDMSIVYTLLDKVSNLVPGNKKQLNETGNETGIQK